jgi:hypothetical protein
VTPRRARPLLVPLLVPSLVTLLVAVSAAGNAQGMRDRGANPGRQRMEQQLRQQVWQITRERVGLTDEQMSRLETTAQRFDARRRALAQDERAQRQILRSELTAPTGGDQERVGAALDRVLQLQRDRLDLQAEEQHELATFMTPVQRARFTALQEQLRRRAAAMRAKRTDAAP